MDVLQLVKKQHELIRALGNGLEREESIVQKRRIFANLAGVVSAQLRIESDYLIPEVTAVDQTAERLGDASLARHELLRVDLKALEKKVNKKPQPSKPTLDKAVSMFFADLKTHLAAIEDEFLHRIRQRIPTQDREDLGLALQDVLAEELEDIGILEEFASVQAAAM